MPGVLMYREFSDGTGERFSLLRKEDTLPPSIPPPPLQPKGLDQQRKQYLYTEIRQFLQRRHRGSYCSQTVHLWFLNIFFKLNHWRQRSGPFSLALGPNDCLFEIYWQTNGINHFFGRFRIRQVSYQPVGLLINNFVIWFYSSWCRKVF